MTRSQYEHDIGWQIYTHMKALLLVRCGKLAEVNLNKPEGGSVWAWTKRGAVQAARYQQVRLSNGIMHWSTEVQTLGELRMRSTTN